MSIECQIEVVPVGQERFHDVDRVVMGQSFAIHNTLGRLCDERIYQDELARRCRDRGLDVQREVEVRVSQGDFVKSCFLDMLVDHGLVYELKTAEALGPRHQQQLINYLLLTGLHHGKLVNFRPASVESRFVSTNLEREARMAMRFSDDGWSGDDPASRRLREVLESLLREWGGCLDLDLYREALLHFLGGADAETRPVEIMVAGRVVGTQPMCLLDETSAWCLSAFRHDLRAHETHFVRLLTHTRLRRLHWINLDRQTVTLKTLVSNFQSHQPTLPNDSVQK